MYVENLPNTQYLIHAVTNIETTTICDIMEKYFIPECFNSSKIHGYGHVLQARY